MRHSINGLSLVLWFYWTIFFFCLTQTGKLSQKFFHSGGHIMSKDNLVASLLRFLNKRQALHQVRVEPVQMSWKKGRSGHVGASWPMPCWAGGRAGPCLPRTNGIQAAGFAEEQLTRTPQSRPCLNSTEFFNWNIWFYMLWGGDLLQLFTLLPSARFACAISWTFYLFRFFMFVHVNSVLGLTKVCFELLHVLCMVL